MTACKESILSEPASGKSFTCYITLYVIKISERIVMEIYIIFQLFFFKSSLDSWTKSSCDHRPRSSTVSRQTTHSWIWCSIYNHHQPRLIFPEDYLSKRVAINFDLIAEKATIILIIPTYMILHLWMPNLPAILSLTHSAFCDLLFLVVSHL